MVEEVEGHVRRVLDALRRSGQYDNTVLLFTADHGEGMAGHRWT